MIMINFNFNNIIFFKLMYKLYDNMWSIWYWSKYFEIVDWNIFFVIWNIKYWNLRCEFYIDNIKI